MELYRLTNSVSWDIHGTTIDPSMYIHYISLVIAYNPLCSPTFLQCVLVPSTFGRAPQGQPSCGMSEDGPNEHVDKHLSSPERPKQVDRGKLGWLQSDEDKLDTESRFCRQQQQMLLQQEQLQNLQNEKGQVEEQVRTLLLLTEKQRVMLEDSQTMLQQQQQQLAEAVGAREEISRVVDQLQNRQQQYDAQMQNNRIKWERELQICRQTLHQRELCLVQSQEQAKQRKSHADTLKQEVVTLTSTLADAQQELNMCRQSLSTALESKGELQLASVRVVELEQQLQQLRTILHSERRDRAHWAQARLDLLSQLCDDPMKQSTTTKTTITSPALASAARRSPVSGLGEGLKADAVGGMSSVSPLEPTCVGGAVAQCLFPAASAPTAAAASPAPVSPTTTTQSPAVVQHHLQQQIHQIHDQLARVQMLHDAQRRQQQVWGSPSRHNHNNKNGHASPEKAHYIHTASPGSVVGWDSTSQLKHDIGGTGNNTSNVATEVTASESVSLRAHAGQ